MSLALSLRARLLLLIFGVLTAVGTVTWTVIRPRFEASVIDERLLLLSQLQSRKLSLVDERIQTWMELMRAASVQLATEPNVMESVFRQYIRLVPDLIGLRIIDQRTGEFLEISTAQFKEQDLNLAEETFFEMAPDSSFRFAWIPAATDSDGKCVLVYSFSAGNVGFQLQGYFDDAYLMDQLQDFGTRGAYFLHLALPGKILETDAVFEGKELTFDVLYRVVRMEAADQKLVGLTARLATIPLGHAVLLDEESVAAPVAKLFVESGWLLLGTLLVLMAGSWALTYILQRPLTQFAEDLSVWEHYDFNKPVRSGNIPEMKRLTEIVNHVRERLARYQEMNVERIIVEQEKNTLLMQFATEMVALLDENEYFRFVNDRFRKLSDDLHWTSMPDSFAELLQKPGVQVQLKQQEDRKQGEINVRTERFELVMASETHQYVFACEKVSLLTPKNAKAGGMVFLHDLTEDRKMDQMRNEMINLIIHELRNPVTGVLGLADLLQTEKDLDEPTKKEFYVLIKNNAQTMVQLINRFLDVARLESNRITLKFETVLLSEILKKTLETFTAQLQKKQLSYTLEISPDEPEIDVSPELMADVFRNLMSNAIKYGPPERVIDIVLSTEMQDWIQVSFTDHGYGIAPEHREKVFQKFYRIKDARSTETGTGLGLPYIKEIVEKHGGALHLESSQDIGSRFTVILPVKKMRN